MIDEFALNAALSRVEKPARYVGGELNSIVKNFDDVKARVAFSYPDVYEVGMSNLAVSILYYLMNERSDCLCERVFAPWPDMEEEMRKRKIPLYSLESREEIRNFDLWGITLQYELSFTNILNMMDLAGVPIHAYERTEKDPIVMAGGPCVYNPEPLADFFDFFIIGEGEEVNIEVLELYIEHKEKGFIKEDFLFELTRIEGVYVPKFYDTVYNSDGTLKSFLPNREGVPKKISKRINRVLDEMFIPKKTMVPFVEIIHDRISMEVFRGCTHGCRFCQAGMIYRPIREKSTKKLLEQGRALVRSSGFEDISLVSLSTCDYSELLRLIRMLSEEFSEEKVSVSLPSLRLDTFSVEALEETEKVRKTGLTFAPEAGSQRMRDIINKGIDENDIEETLKFVFEEGFSSVKLYFMIGLPEENMEDVRGIGELAYKVRDLFFSRPKELRKGNLKVTASTSCFVPKPFTPFQWVGQNGIDEFYEKIELLKAQIRDPKVKYRYHEPETSRIEAIIARGDRKVGRLIERAFFKGQKFDGWDYYFNYDVWCEAMEEIGMDGDFYSKRERSYDEIFPWDFLDIGVSKEFLLKELHKAKRGELTPDCRKSCNGCGIKNCTMH